MMHNLFLLFFIAGYLLSAIFLCAEYQRLGVHQRQYRILRISFWIKLAFILVEVALAVAFGVLTYREGYQVAAVLEWVIALIFTFWVVSFFVDLLPVAKRARKQEGTGQVEMDAAPGIEFMEREGLVAANGGSGYANASIASGNGQNGYAHGYANRTLYPVVGDPTAKPLPAAQNF